MHSPFQNGPAATFAEPIELLKACHGKVTRFSQDLRALPGYVNEHGVNDVVIQAIAQIRHYFSLGAKLHHQDEEDNLFPLLRTYAPHTAADINALCLDHERLNQAWQTIEVSLAQLPQQPQTDLSALPLFAQNYAEHMLREEPLLDLALSVIPADLLSEIGHAMAARRQQT